MNKIVLVTGGSRGIGAATVQAFAQAGCRVILNYNKSEAAARAIADAWPGQVFPVQADVSDPAQVEELFRQAEALCGPVEVLVCNAGLAQQKLFTDLTDADWARMIGVHLSGAFYCCRRALPGMIRRKWGRILTVSSMWGQTGGSCEVHYSAAKAGLIGLTKALAKETAPSGITVNCLCPGVIQTDMLSSFTPQDLENLREENPVGRLGTPGDVSSAALWLAAEGSGFITGQIIGVNGGFGE